MKRNAQLDVTIVILSYNSKKVTDNCLAKVEKSVAASEKMWGNEITTIVVDNASADGSPEMIRKKYPWVKLVALKENIGYSRGNNVAMKMATTPYIILMNSDTYINPDSIAVTFEEMLKRPEADVLVSRYGYENGVLQRYGGYLPTPFKIIIWSFGFESVPILKRYLHRIYGFNLDFYDREGRMEWCSPCFLLMKKKVYTLTKGFDEKLFFHMIDAEWCQRIYDKGLKIFFTPRIQVIHLGGASSKGILNTLTKDNFKGLMHFSKKHYPNSVGLISFFLKIGLKMRSTFFAWTNKPELAATYRDIAREVLTY